MWTTYSRRTFTPNFYVNMMTPVTIFRHPFINSFYLFLMQHSFRVDVEIALLLIFYSLPEDILMSPFRMYYIKICSVNLIITTAIVENALTDKVTIRQFIFTFKRLIQRSVKSRDSIRFQLYVFYIRIKA